MNEKKVQFAANEATRFVITAEIYLERLKDEGEGSGTKESGALRRASMDLTRALAEMRKP